MVRPKDFTVESTLTSVWPFSRFFEQDSSALTNMIQAHLRACGSPMYQFGLDDRLIQQVRKILKSAQQRTNLGKKIQCDRCQLVGKLLWLFQCKISPINGEPIFDAAYEDNTFIWYQKRTKWRVGPELDRNLVPEYMNHFCTMGIDSFQTMFVAEIVFEMYSQMKVNIFDITSNSWNSLPDVPQDVDDHFLSCSLSQQYTKNSSERLYRRFFICSMLRYFVT